MILDLFKVLAIASVVWVGFTALMFVIGLMFEANKRENLRLSMQFSSVVSAAFGIIVTAGFLIVMIAS